MIDIGELERIEFYYLDTSFTDSLEMAFLLWFIVGPISESIEQCPDFYAFFYFFGKQIEECIGDRVISKVEIFQMNVVFGTAYGFKKVIEFFTPAGKQFYFVAVSDGNARFLKEVDHHLFAG